MAIRNSRLILAAFVCSITLVAYQNCGDSKGLTQSDSQVVGLEISAENSEQLDSAISETEISDSNSEQLNDSGVASRSVSSADSLGPLPPVIPPTNPRYRSSVKRSEIQYFTNRGASWWIGPTVLPSVLESVLAQHPSLAQYHVCQNVLGSGYSIRCEGIMGADYGAQKRGGYNFMFGLPNYRTYGISMAIALGMKPYLKSNSGIRCLPRQSAISEDVESGQQIYATYPAKPKKNLRVEVLCETPLGSEAQLAEVRAVYEKSYPIKTQVTAITTYSPGRVNVELPATSLVLKCEPGFRESGHRPKPGAAYVSCSGRFKVDLSAMPEDY